MTLNSWRWTAAAGDMHSDDHVSEGFSNSSSFLTERTDNVVVSWERSSCSMRSGWSVIQQSPRHSVWRYDWYRQKHNIWSQNKDFTQQEPILRNHKIFLKFEKNASKRPTSSNLLHKVLWIQLTWGVSTRVLGIWNRSRPSKWICIISWYLKPHAHS